MGETKMVVFRVGAQEYAADIAEVQEVIRPPPITPLPHPTPPLVGVFNLRGTIVTALDAHASLGLPVGRERPTRAVVFQARGRTVGFLVDAASHVLTVDDAHVKAPPEARKGQPARGVIIHEGRPIVLLDTSRLLAPGQDPAAAEAVP